MPTTLDYGVTVQGCAGGKHGEPSRACDRCSVQRRGLAPKTRVDGRTHEDVKKVGLVGSDAESVILRSLKRKNQPGSRNTASICLGRCCRKPLKTVRGRGSDLEIKVCVDVRFSSCTASTFDLCHIFGLVDRV